MTRNCWQRAWPGTRGLTWLVLSGAITVTSCGAPRGTGGPAVAADAVRSFCAGRPLATQAAPLPHAVALSLRDEVIPLGVSADGGTAYVSLWTPRFSGVAALILASGALRPIMRFANAATDQADGAWGGRWLVWEQTYSLQSLDGFTVFGWNSGTGAVVRLGQSLASPAGTPWPSPWHAPAVQGDYAAWAQGYSPGGQVEIRLADLRTGTVTVVAQGHVQAPFFDAGLLVWPESDRPGSLTSLHAYDISTGRPAPLPVVLRSVRGTDFVATDGTRTAYLGPGLATLYYSPAPAQTASVVLRLPPGIAFSNLGIGSDGIAWTTTRATYLANTMTGRYVQVTPAYGYAVTGQGADVLVSDGPTSKAAHPILALHEVDAAAIGGLACAR